MPLFRRISDIISANLNEMVEHFEDPETMLRQAVREMDQALASALDRAVTAVAHEKLLTRQLEENRRQVERWQDRALQAVKAGDDSLARRAVARRIEHQKLVEALEDQQTGAAGLSRRLRRQIEAMRIKLAETKRRLAAMCARQRVAQVQRKLFSSPCRGGEASNLERWIARMELAEAETDAWCELTGGAGDEDLFDDFDDVQIEHELNLLKESRRE